MTQVDQRFDSSLSSNVKLSDRSSIVQCIGEGKTGFATLKDAVPRKQISTYEFIVKKSPHMNVFVMAQLFKQAPKKLFQKRGKLEPVSSWRYSLFTGKKSDDEGRSWLSYGEPAKEGN